MKEYLVTGGAGFIGSCLTKRLVQNGNKVTIIDNLSTGFESNIPNNVDFIQGDCQDKKIYKGLNKKFDAIYHLAGQSSGEISFDDPIYDLQTNTQSTLLLLKYSLDTGCNRFLYASSMSVYGDHPDFPIEENMICKPKSFYGVGKVASEYYMNIYQKLGIITTSLRMFNVYGPGQNMDNLRQGMVSIFLAMAMNNKHIVVKGNTDRFRDFIYIDDIIDALIISENNPNAFNKVFNLATGIKTTVDTLLNNLKELLPYDVSIEIKGNTPGDQFGIYGDIEEIKKALDWNPKYSLELGLKEMIKVLLES